MGTGPEVCTVRATTTWVLVMLEVCVDDVRVVRVEESFSAWERAKDEDFSQDSDSLGGPGACNEPF